MNEDRKTWEQEEKERNEIVLDIGSNMFVEAGAGAGKTSILIRRILNQLKSGTVKPEELVVITFTNKATQELKTRIGEEVRRALHDASYSAEEHRNLKEALYSLDRMQVSTIHSFCIRLLKEQSFAASMRLDMEMVEEDEVAERQDVFFGEWYKSLDYEKLHDLRENYADRGLTSTLKSTFRAICELPSDVEIFYDRDSLKKTLKDFEEEAAEKKAEFSEMVLEELEQEGFSFDSLESAAEEGAFLNGMKTLIQNKTSDMDFLKKMKKEKERIFKSGGSLKMKKPQCDEMTAHVKDAFYGKFDIDAFENSLNTYQNALILDFLLPAREAYRKLYESRYITNNTLLEKAKNLVVDHPEARAFFRRKYKCIYVDEFQDTDHVQTDLIFALCSDDHGGLRKGSLFLVGDPKQSIYRFRGADLPLYYSVKKKMAEMPDCRVFHLNFNFRSGEEVVSFVNENNKILMEDYQPMISRSGEGKENRPERQLSGVYLTWDPKTDLKDQAKRYDVADVVSTIRGLVGSDVMIWDKDKKGYRGITYSDFLVLCYSTTGMSDYLSAMLNAGIPVRISGKMTISDIRELNRFIYLYRYLAYPYYKKAEEGALQTVLSQNVNDLNQKLGKERLTRVREELEGLDGLSMALSLSRHLEYLLDQDKVIEKNSIVRIQAQLEQMIETVSRSVPNNPQALSDGFEDYLASELDRELSLTSEADSVRFMNIHKAKGLEGRIVIICKRNENFTSRDVSFLTKKDSDSGYIYYPTVERQTNQYDKTTFAAYANDDSIRNTAESEELAEYRRLEYVECTRGMEALIFLMPQAGDAKEYSFKHYDFSGYKRIDLLFPEFYQNEAFFEPSMESAGAETADYSEYDLLRWAQENQDEQRVVEYISITPSSLEQSVSARASDAANETDSPEEGGGEETEGSEDRPSGNIFGTVMHRALELLVGLIRDSSDKVPEQKMEECILQALMESGDEMEDAFGDAYEEKVEQYHSFLKKVLLNYSEKETFCKAIRSAANIFTELPFSFFTTEADMPEMFESLRTLLTAKKADKLLPSDPSMPVWINGKADLILLNEDRSITVIDYKSDMNPGLEKEAFKELIWKRYGGQMEMYRHVCGKLFGVSLGEITGEFCLLE